MLAFFGAPTAERLRQEAEGLVTYIFDHAPEDLRASFASQPEVLQILRPQAV